MKWKTHVAQKSCPGDRTPQCPSLDAEIAVTQFDTVSTLLCCEKSKARSLLKSAGCFCCCCFVLPFEVLFPFCAHKGKTVVLRHFLRWGVRGSRAAVYEMLQVYPFWKDQNIPLRTVVWGTLWFLHAVTWVVSLLHYAAWIFWLV